MKLKIGDKVYIVCDYSKDNPEFDIVEVTCIHSNSFDCNPIIGDWKTYTFVEPICELDFAELITREYHSSLILPDYVTINEELAIEKYKQLLKEHGTV